MTVPILPAGLVTPGATTAAPTARTGPAGDLQKVASEFEAMLLRQLLTSAKMGGEGGYSSMAVDALASGITRAGGIGLAHELETALGAVAGTRDAATAISHSSPAGGGRSSE